MTNQGKQHKDLSLTLRFFHVRTFFCCVWRLNWSQCKYVSQWQDKTKSGMNPWLGIRFIIRQSHCFRFSCCCQACHVKPQMYGNTYHVSVYNLQQRWSTTRRLIHLTKRNSQRNLITESLNNIKKSGWEVSYAISIETNLIFFSQTRRKLIYIC